MIMTTAYGTNGSIKAFSGGFDERVVSLAFMPFGQRSVVVC